MPTHPITGIDLLIARGPDLDDVVRAVETIAGIERFALKLPDEPDEKNVDILEHANWAAIDAYAGGDFAFKVDSLWPQHARLSCHRPRVRCALAHHGRLAR